MKAILATGLGLSLATGVFAPGLLLPAWGQRLGWTLVHSIWQVTLVALVAGVVLACLRRHSARLRYGLGVVCLALMLIVPAITWSMVTIATPAAVLATNDLPALPPIATSAIGNASSVSGSQIDTATLSLGPAPTLSGDGRAPLRDHQAPVPPAEISQRVPVTSNRDWLERVRQSILPWLGQIVAVWLAGVLCCAIRPVAGLWTQWLLKRRGLSPVAIETQRLMSDLARRMNVSPVVRIAESALVQVPMVVGYLRPIILLPACVLIGMTPDQLTSLLAHELGHIRRHDWIVNAIQVVVETLMFYHPAVWWLSHRIRCERELCCDDLALAVIGDNLAYGRMLLTLEELRHRMSTPVTALAGTSGDLVQRIRRLMPHAATPERAERGWLGGILILGLLATFFIGGLTTTRSDAEPQQEVTEEAATESDPLPPQKNQGIVRGRIITADQSPLPPDLKLQRRITGSNFAEQVKDVALNSNGEFTINVAHETAFVSLYATSKEFAPGSIPRIEVKRGEQVGLVIKMERGSTVQVNLRSTEGTHPTSGTATVTLRNPFEPNLGTFPIDSHGNVAIAHCPNEPVQIDFDMPGFEEQRIRLRPNIFVPTTVTIRPTKPARFQVVDANRQPIANAKVRLYSRVRTDSFMRSRTESGDGPVWGVSDSDGRVELTTLCTVDPVPTNDPGLADYVFRIDAPGQAPYYVGPVRAGSDLGQIQLSKALRVDGEIIRDAAQPERVNVQWRQATLEQGASTGKGEWTTAKLAEADGRLLLKLTDLQPGRFDLFITFSDPKVPANQIGGTIRQLEFHGTLTNSSAGLKITRDSVTPGDANLTAARASLFPIDEMPPGNLPEHAIRQFDAHVTITGNGLRLRTVEEGGVIVSNERPRFKPLLTWSHTAPVQHSMGYVNWRVIILEDGTVIVPPSQSNDIGAHHRLSPGELRLLTALLNKYPDFWGTQVPSSDPELGNWRHGSESIVYIRDGKPKAFHAWDVADTVIDPKIAEAKETITFQLEQIILEAKCGGRAALEKYRELAGRAFLTAFPNATPSDDTDGDDWFNVAIEPDGSRQIELGGTIGNSRVSLVHPIGGQPYIEYVEFQNQRTVAVVPLEAIQSQVDAEAMKIAGVVQDERRHPIPHAKVVLCLANAADDGEQMNFVATGQADEQGRYALTVPEKNKGLYQPKTKAVVWAMADKFGVGIICYSLAGQPPVSQPLSVAKTVEIRITDENKQPIAGQITRLNLDHFQVPPQFSEHMLVTRDNGLFEIKQMPSEFLDDDLESSHLRELHVKTQTHGVQSFMWRTDMTAVHEGQEPVELVVRPLATFSGQLIVLPMARTNNVVINVETFNGESTMKQPWCSGHATTTTDASGRFALQVASGRLRQFQTSRPAGASWRSLIQSRDEIVLHPGDNPPINIPLVQTRKLRGTVIRPNGAGVPGVEFSVAHGLPRTTVISENMSSHRSEYTETAVTNADGLFSLDVIPGDIRVNIQLVPEGGITSADLWPDRNPQPIAWGPGKVIRVPQGDGDFELPAITRTSHTGTLLNEFGKPLEGVIYVGGQGRGWSHSDADGKFAFEVIGHATEWTVAPKNETGDFGLPTAKSPNTKIVRESPLVLQVVAQPEVERKSKTDEQSSLQPKGEKQAQPAAANQEPPWSVFGNVVDGDGKPVRGAKVWASTGVGSLFTTGSAETNEQGRYEFHFGPGVSFEAKDQVQLQAATIMVSKPGFFEKNLSRQGDLRMARKVPETPEWAKRKNDIILPDVPRQIDFILLPAAHLAGTLIDADDKPLAGYRISLTGDDLPPSSSVIGSTKSDEKGQFRLSEIPTSFKYQILVEPPTAEPPWNAWASGPFDFRVSSGDEFFIQQTDREVAAIRFELQIKGAGVNWRSALKAGGDRQKLEPTADYLVSKSRLHTATIRLTLDPTDDAEVPPKKDGTKQE
jgi:beta-lactamase regulating signal transducer with metallopeptidase domain